MSFQIPGDLGRYSLSGLQDLLNQANAEFDTVFSAVDPDVPDPDAVAHLEALQQFRRIDAPLAIKKAREAHAAQVDAQSRFAALNAGPEETPEAEPVVEGEVLPPDPEAVTASSRVTVADIANSGNGTITLTPQPTQQRYSTIVASAGVPNFNQGQELPTMLDIAKAFEARASSHGQFRGRGATIHMQPVAQLVRDYPTEFSVQGDETDYDKLLKVADETRLPGGNLLRAVENRRAEMEKSGATADSLVAAAGWCAPSETDYSICLQISTDGLANFPEVQARRGGIRHNTGIQFDEIFGGGSCSSPTGFFDLTEAQVASGTIKTCLEIPCPEFVDTRLGVTGLCLTGNILSIRGYPEFTATFTRGALAAHAHQVNREQIADVVSASTAVDLSAAAPWATDGSTVSQVLSAVEMAIVDIKYRMRLARSTTLEVVMPWWILAQMRADWIRRNGGNYNEMLTLADARINEAFSARGARVQYVYDWQDAFATCAASGSPGADTEITSLPSELQFLVYPSGTWVRAVSDVITLNSVYDSTKLATNQVTHLFTETGWAMVQMCPVSRVYTVPICPSGKTTSQGTLTCP
jgi:hypothetical protein